MPSLSEATPQQWQRMRLSTQLATYEIFDAVRAGSPTLERHRDTIEQMIEAGWLQRDGEQLVVTLAGQDHLSA